MAYPSRWNMEALPWHELQRERISGNEELFYLVTTASLIEITSDLYTRNLLQHYAGDEEVTTWLREGWEVEEVQHGRALREYARRAWPDFDWDAVYAAFLEEYGARCKPEALLPQRSLEMASRCVVEMGTATFYTALERFADEPLLKRLARHIYEDEISHYKHFYKYFRRYRERDRVTRAQVLGALWHRLKLIEDEDSYLALKYVYAARHPGRRYDRRVYKTIVKRCRAKISCHVPHELSVKMLLKPLDMAPSVERWVQPVMESVARAVA
jgi:hypothetical protein